MTSWTERPSRGRGPRRPYEVRAALSLVDPDGQVVERAVNRFTLQGEMFTIFTTDA